MARPTICAGPIDLVQVPILWHDVTLTFICQLKALEAAVGPDPLIASNPLFHSPNMRLHLCLHQTINLQCTNLSHLQEAQCC